MDCSKSALGPLCVGDRVDHFEAVLIRETLQATQGNMSEAIALLEVPRKTLYAKLKRHGIEPNLFRVRSAQN